MPTQTIDLPAAVASLQARLAAGDVRSSVDLAGLNPPAVLVVPPALTPRFCGRWQLTWNVYLVSPDTGRMEALRHLSTLINGWSGIVRPANMTAVDLIDTTGHATPAYQFTFTEES